MARSPSPRRRPALALMAAAALAGLGSASGLPGLREAREALPGARTEPVVAPRKKAFEDALGGREAAKPMLRERLRGWPERALVPRDELPRDDDAFLRRLARDTWRGLDALADRENGLPIDHLLLPPGGSLDPRDARIGDYASPTNIGLYLIALVSARELGLVDAAGAEARAARVLASLERLEQRGGFLFNFYDTTTLERTSDFVSFVDSTWLTAGLVVTRRSFPALAARATRRLEAVDYALFYDPGRGLMRHGFFVAPLERSPYHYGTLFTEARLGSLLAIGKGDVPAAHWRAMERTLFPRGLAARERLLRRVSSRPPAPAPAAVRDFEGIRFVPSWGGSLFEALMPALVLDERRHAPQSLGRNAEAHAEIQRRYALERLGYPVWGLSPCWSPHAPVYAEYGIPPLGDQPYATGVVTPHASALALAVLPAAAAENLRTLADRYDLYGDYGLYDAVDPRTGAVARAWLALDQSMILIALANHLAGGVIPARFGADPIVESLLPIVRGARLFE